MFTAILVLIPVSPCSQLSHCLFAPYEAHLNSIYLKQYIVCYLIVYFLITRPIETLSTCNHSHKKWKDSLETLAEPVVFSLQLKFRKLLEPSLREPASNINKQVQGTMKQFKIKGLPSCFVLNLRISGVN